MNVVMDGRRALHRGAGHRRAARRSTARVSTRCSTSPSRGIDELIAIQRRGRRGGARCLRVLTDSPGVPAASASSCRHAATTASSPRSARALDFPGWRFVAAAELDAEWPSPEEDGETFEDNARIKAHAPRASASALAALADDSGLEVDALDGEPGVSQRRYAGPCADRRREQPPAAARARRRARGPSAPRASAARSSSSTRTAPRPSPTARARAASASSRAASGGFGYDPLFLPDATPGRTMAELYARREERDQPPRRGACATLACEARGA